MYIRACRTLTKRPFTNLIAPTQITPHHIIPYHASLHCSTPHCTTPHDTTPHHTTPINCLLILTWWSFSPLTETFRMENLSTLYWDMQPWRQSGESHQETLLTPWRWPLLICPPWIWLVKDKEQERETQRERHTQTGRQINRQTDKYVERKIK